MSVETMNTNKITDSTPKYKKPILDPITQKFIDDLKNQNSAPIYTLSVEAARKKFNDIQGDPVDESELHIERIPIQNGNASIKLIRPKYLVTKELPCVIYFPGGGWVLGSEKTHQRLVTEIALGADVALAYVLYKNAPEAQYKEILTQAYDAVNYIMLHGPEHKINIRKIVVAGDSAGGNLTIVMTLYANETWPKFVHQILLYPVTSATLNTKSYEKFADGPWLTRKAMEWFWNAYAPDPNVCNEVYLSPINAPMEMLKHVPPALIVTDENDVLRDEGEAYAHKLMEAGVETVAIRYLSIIHDFLMLNALKNSPATISLRNMVIDTIKRAVY